MNTLQRIDQHIKFLAVKGNKTAQKLWTMEHLDDFVHAVNYERKLLICLDYWSKVRNFQLLRQVHQEMIKFTLIHMDEVYSIFQKWCSTRQYKGEAFSPDWITHKCITHMTSDTCTQAFAESHERAFLN